MKDGYLTPLEQQVWAAAFGSAYAAEAAQFTARVNSSAKGIADMAVEDLRKLQRDDANIGFYVEP